MAILRIVDFDEVFWLCQSQAYVETRADLQLGFNVIKYEAIAVPNEHRDNLWQVIPVSHIARTHHSERADARLVILIPQSSHIGDDVHVLAF